MTEAGGARILFLDVGQGDATLVVDRQTGAALLVDCPAGREGTVEQALDHHGAWLDTAVISHFDSDHSAGLVTLLRTRSCREVLFVQDPRPTDTVLAQYRDLVAAGRRGLITTTVRRGDSGKLGVLSWQVLSPQGRTVLSASAAQDRNRASIVLRVVVSPQSKSGGVPRAVLLAGDADASVWQTLLGAGDDLSCDLLLWPHHGAGMGLSPTARGLPARVLQATSPRAVLISVGSRNGYGHPAAAVIASAASAGRRVMCSQVTPRCEAAAGGGTACAGTTNALIDARGRLVISPPPRVHGAVIDGWSTPMCRSGSSPAASAGTAPPSKP